MSAFTYSRGIAVDETYVKANGLEYYVFSALNIDRNEIVRMRIYPSRNMLATESFFRRVFFNNITVNLRYNEGMRWRRSIECRNLICDMFTYHHNNLRR